MTVESPRGDVSAAAFFNMAREYQNAANQLLDLNARTPFSNPVALLYHHAVELALKAFLRSVNCRILRTPLQSHKLRRLYDECHSRGLEISPGDRVGVENVVNLLEGGNEDHGFRYFNLKSVTVPNLAWTREAVDGLMRAVELQVGDTRKPGPPAKMRIIFGMAEQKR